MLRVPSPPQNGLLDGYFVEISPPAQSPRKGTLFVEARLKDESLESGIATHESCAAYAKVLEAELGNNANTFDLLEDILADEENAKRKLGDDFHQARSSLQSLRVVEYVGPIRTRKRFSSSEVQVKVQVFQLHRGSPLVDEEREDGQLGELVPMPHARFEGVWDELVFDHELKADLIWMMNNILRFSRAFEKHKIRRKLNPLILLHGPPGTGKTSLCLGLGQKISIRLSNTYTCTTLIQIKTAILLSKYYSESAKHVDDIFNRIIAMCEDRPDRFVCVVIDEVESIASSREFSTKEGESLDSMRATNALLTGIDRTAGYSNVVFLFTSNMYDALEPAFLDRCGLKEFVGPPNMAAQYEILRSVLEKLVECQVIHSAVRLPSFDEAIMGAAAGTLSHLPGPKLFEITKLINSRTDDIGTQLSGRSLVQLPEKALMKYLRGEECDLDLALELLRKCVLEAMSITKTDDNDIEVHRVNDTQAEGKEHGWKQMATALFGEDLENINKKPEIPRTRKKQETPIEVESIRATKSATSNVNESRNVDDLDLPFPDIIPKSQGSGGAKRKIPTPEECIWMNSPSFSDKIEASRDEQGDSKAGKRTKT